MVNLTKPLKCMKGLTQTAISPIIIAIIVGLVIVAASYITVNLPKTDYTKTNESTTTTSQTSKDTTTTLPQAICGNNNCESGESSNNCCQDCGCSSGFTCQNNICVELKPNVEVSSFLQTTPVGSVTYLRAKGTSIAKISLSNDGNDVANNLKITITSPNQYFGEKIIDIGSLSKSQSKEVNIDLNFFDSVLNIVTDTKLQLNMKLEFYNSVNKKYESTDSKELSVDGRNTFHWSYPQMVASWVTPNQPVIKQFASRATGGLATYATTTQQMLAARWLFETMRSYGVAYVTDPTKGLDFVQFPIETLTNKGGDCEDNAILYASLLESVGVNSVIVLIPGHAFSGFVNKEGQVVPIETTANDFDSALTSGNYTYIQHQSDRTVVYPSREWINYPQVVLPETTQLAMPYITKQIGSCNVGWTWDKGFVASVPVKFTNSGNAPGAGCAAAITYDANRNELGEDLSCWVINPGETKDVTYNPDISISNWLTGYYCSAV